MAESRHGLMVGLTTDRAVSGPSSDYRTGNPYMGHVTAPARKTCPCCQRPNILLNKRSTFGLAYSGRPICSRCIQTARLELQFDMPDGTPWA